MYDVAIVGFGPAGAVAAGLLGQAGLKVHVCDRRQGVYEIPRASAAPPGHGTGSSTGATTPRPAG